MKIGILNYHSLNNYGSVLLAYATKKAVEKLGHRCEIIDFRTEKAERMYKIFQKPESVGKILRNAYSLVHYRKLKEKYEKYERFRKKYLNLSQERFRTAEELEKTNSRYDAFICGSDQIWNLKASEHDQAYFLPFVRRKKRIAYAPSFGGMDRLTEEEIQAVKPYLERFHFISVREDAGRKIIRQVLDRDAEVLVDPVLLLEEKDWNALLKPMELKKKPYILCYSLGSSTDALKCAEKIRRMTGLHVVHLIPYWKTVKYKGERRFDAGPENFLWLVKNAEFVCSNSFHATALSIRFHVKFLYTNQNVRRDPRIDTLFASLNLPDRYIRSPEEINASHLKEMDWIPIHRELDKQRLKSLNLLSKALEKQPSGAAPASKRVRQRI